MLPILWYPAGELSGGIGCPTRYHTAQEFQLADCPKWPSRRKWRGWCSGSDALWKTRPGCEHQIPEGLSLRRDFQMRAAWRGLINSLSASEPRRFVPETARQDRQRAV